MSFTTDYLLDKAFAERADAGRVQEPEHPVRGLPVRIALRRRNPRPGGRWDPLWPASLSRAARELAIDNILVNDGMFVADEAQRRRVVRRAEELREETEARIYRRPGPAADRRSI